MTKSISSSLSPFIIYVEYLPVYKVVLVVHEQRTSAQLGIICQGLDYDVNTTFECVTELYRINMRTN